jgi:hypothetical protein
MNSSTKTAGTVASRAEQTAGTLALFGRSDQQFNAFMCLSLTAQADSGHISIDERRAQGYFTLFS